MRRIILFLQLLLGVEMIYAQTETEILNYSRLSYAGLPYRHGAGVRLGQLLWAVLSELWEEIFLPGI